ncbi:MAG TPA: helix-turn-helix domain-containing protein [Solirubrobacteraceae bacterium]
MPRPSIHEPDDVLDAARDLVLEAGPRAVGIRAIGERSGAPSGSLYHRFGSREELLARTWLRAVRRFQDGYLRALDAEDPHAAALEAAAWSIGFALANPRDTRLLLEHSRLALMEGAARHPLADELAQINEPIVRAVHRLAMELYGEQDGDAVERVFYAVIDLPLAVLRRHLQAGTLSERTVASLQSAVSALLGAQSSPPLTVAGAPS